MTENIIIAKTFNSYFESITDSLGLFNWPLQSDNPIKKCKILLKNNLLSDKATAEEIPVNLLKIVKFAFFELTNCINEAIRNKVSRFLKTIWYNTSVQNTWP